MKRWRQGLAAAGVLLGLYGVYRLVSGNSLADLVVIGLWILGAVAIHDGLVAPVVVSLGSALAHIPARARRYLQFALILAGAVTVIAVPLIYRQGTQPASKSLLERDYGANLTLLLTMIAAGSLVAYAVAVGRSRSRREPSADRDIVEAHGG